jgi:hypothetical protein
MKEKQKQQRKNLAKATEWKHKRCIEKQRV